MGKKIFDFDYKTKDGIKTNPAFHFNRTGRYKASGKVNMVVTINSPKLGKIGSKIRLPLSVLDLPLNKQTELAKKALDEYYELDTIVENIVEPFFKE